MFRLPHVPKADELIDNAFRAGSEKAKAVRSTRKGWRDERLRKSEEERVKTASRIMCSNLKAIVKHFPSYDNLPEFYKKLLDLKISKDRYKKSLGAVQWCLNNIISLQNRILKKISETKDSSSVKEFLGRSSSFIRQISKELDDLAEMKAVLEAFPRVEDVPTLVIAGYPNVGKSTFMRNLTGSNVRVAPYPFTTKEIKIGYANIRYRRHQIIDSPGILDRPMEERNQIELQAILAISELADAILFLIDPTQATEPQDALLKEIKEKFSIPVVAVINKSDEADPEVIEALKKKFGLGSDKVISSLNSEDCRRIFEEVFISLNLEEGLSARHKRQEV